MENGFEILDSMRNRIVYKGTLSPFGIRHMENNYIVKKCRAGTDGCKCEAIANKIYNNFGLDAQVAYIGSYHGENCSIIEELDSICKNNILTSKDMMIYMSDDIIRHMEELGCKNYNRNEIEDELYRVAMADFVFGNFDRRTSAITFKNTNGMYHIGRLIDNESIFGCGMEIREYIRIKNIGGYNAARYIIDHMVNNWIRIIDTRKCRSIQDVGEIFRERGYRIQRNDIRLVLQSVKINAMTVGFEYEQVIMMMFTVMLRMMAIAGIDEHEDIREDIKEYMIT